MSEFIGREDNLLLFIEGSRGVIVDAESNTVTASGFADVLLEEHVWLSGTESRIAAELADAALTGLNVAVTASAGRMYSIPKSVQSEAKKALEWRKDKKRGGTSVGLNTAHILARGGQIGLEKLRHIAKYFPRHQVDKKGTGWSPGDDGFPSNGRIAWALWGGDAAERWASHIVDTANKKSLTADGYGLPDYDYDDPQVGPDMDAFQDALDINGEQGPEFIARVRMDGTGIDRLYKVDMDGTVAVWDDMDWDTLGEVGGDIWTYDSALDDVYDNVETTHVLIDPESAIMLAANFTENPFQPVSIEDLVPEEAYLAADAADDIDYELTDSTVLAAGEAPAVPGDGYTQQERSQNASKQQRDGDGKFAKVGGRVIINKDPGLTGTITHIDQNTGTAIVALENGKAPVQVSVKNTTAIGPQTQTQPNAPVATDKVDLSGILAEPRTPINRQLAQLPGTLPPMTPDDLHQLLNDWPAYVAQQRQTQTPPDPKKVKVKSNLLDVGPEGRAIEKQTGEKIILDAYKHPLLKNWLKKKNGQGVNNDLYYNPITADAAPAATDDAAPAPEHEVTPTTSDVEPIYMALVAPDDPQAVLNLIALVPASSTSTAPMTYERQNGQWVRNPQMVNDLKSATPPPVVPLDADMLNDVLQQVDQTQSGQSDDSTSTDPAPAATPVAASVSPDFALTVLWGLDAAAIIAAGGADRNRGGAEKLRRYWVHGEGAAKIRWGTPGDWTRCVRHLGKYMGERAKGYCQLRHKEADGYYTGDKRNLATQEELDKPILEYIAEGVEDPEFDNEFEAPTEITDEISNLYGDVQEQQEGMLEDAGIAWKDRAALNLVAAGGLDRDRGNAEKLRRYWTVGPGGAKISWGTGGDWTRCVRHLGKYLGPRSKGYCALRHKEMTGMWTGDKKHRRIFGRTNGHSVFSNEYLKSEEAIVSAAWLRAEKATLKARIQGLTAGATAAEEVSPGAAFTIPLVIPEQVESGDGRIFKANAITMRDLPLPLLWQQESADGHSGSVVVGRIDTMERIDGGIGNAHGVFDNGEYGREAERLVRNGFLRGVSADMDQFEASPEEKDAELGVGDDDDNLPEVKQERLIISKSRIMAVTIVPKPAFQECSINIDDAPQSQEDDVIPDGIYVDDMDPVEASALVAAGYVAESIPLTPPAEWFTDPQLAAATPLTVDDSGRVFGHIASWQQDHIGRVNTRAPRSRSGYAYFHTGVVRTEEGSDVPVGQLTLAGGHATLEASAAQAVKHYDDTASAIADVHAGEDAFGIWVAGSLRPNAQPEQIRALRASAPSGDWRPIKGQLELVAVCQVNVPGFPVARAMVASGQVYALVAAGAEVLARMKSDPVAELSERIKNLETSLTAVDLRPQANDVRARFATLKAEAEEAAEFKYRNLTKKDREKAAKNGTATRDGLYPIRNVEDLKVSIRSVGQAKPEDRDRVRRHIIKRARALGRGNLIPDKWKDLATDEEIAIIDQEIRSELAAEAEALSARFSEVSDFAFIPKKKRDELAQKGHAMPDGSFPISNESDLKKAVHAYGRTTDEKKAAVRKHIQKRARALGKTDAIPDSWKTAQTDSITASLERMRSTIAARSEVGELSAPKDLTPLQRQQEEDAKRILEQNNPALIADDAAAPKQTQPGKYTPKTQPRDEQGKFRLILARLRSDLGTSGNQDVLDKIKAVENLDNTGNYRASVDSAADLYNTLDRMDQGALDKNTRTNLRSATTQLSKTIANLPLPFANQAQKVRFSDLPPALREMSQRFIDKVTQKMGTAKAAPITAEMKNFMSGAEVFSQSEINAQLNRLLRYLD